LGKDERKLSRQLPDTLQELYDKYSEMLFGYIYEIVKDAHIAEQYLIKIYHNVAQHLQEINNDGANAWCQLLRIAKHHLSDVFTSEDYLTRANAGIYNINNKFLNLMNEDQQQVFCSIYYCGKKTCELSQMLGRPEDAIRKSLKEALIIIKKGK